MLFKHLIMCYEPGYENLFFQLTARHPEPDNPNWKLFRSEGEVIVYRIVDNYNNCVWEKDIRPDGIRYSLGIYEDNPITQIKSYDRIWDTRVRVSLETLTSLTANGLHPKFPIEVPLPTLNEVDRILKKYDQ